jgi:hypothetical protein
VKEKAPITTFEPIDGLDPDKLPEVPGFAEDFAAAGQAHEDGRTRSAADVFEDLETDRGQ